MWLWCVRGGGDSGEWLSCRSIIELPGQQPPLVCFPWHRRVRVFGDDVRIMRCYPGQWQVRRAHNSGSRSMRAVDWTGCLALSLHPLLVDAAYLATFASAFAAGALCTLRPTCEYSTAELRGCQAHVPTPHPVAQGGARVQVRQMDSKHYTADKASRQLC